MSRVGWRQGGVETTRQQFTRQIAGKSGGDTRLSCIYLTYGILHACHPVVSNLTFLRWHLLAPSVVQQHISRQWRQARRRGGNGWQRLATAANCCLLATQVCTDTPAHSAQLTTNSAAMRRCDWSYPPFTALWPYSFLSFSVVTTAPAARTPLQLTLLTRPLRHPSSFHLRGWSILGAGQRAEDREGVTTGEVER